MHLSAYRVGVSNLMHESLCAVRTHASSQTCWQRVSKSLSSNIISPFAVTGITGQSRPTCGGLSPALTSMNQSPASPLVGPQMWKLWLSLAGLVAAGLGLYAPRFLGGTLGADPALVSVMSVVAGLGVFIAAWVSVRCPECRLSLVGHALSNQSHTAWLAWLITVQECPRCQYSSPRKNGDQENAI